MRTTAAIAIVLAAESGCSGAGDDSCGLPTEELSIISIGTDNGRELRVEVDIDEGDRTLSEPVSLCGKDTLTINDEGVTETPKFDRIVYSRTFPLGAAPKELRFELLRAVTGETIRWSVQMPEAFEILEPRHSARASRGSPIEIAWEPASEGNDMQIELNEDIGGGVCLQTPIPRHNYKQPGGISVDDIGTWTIPAEAIASEELLRICGAELKLSRTRLGAYPEALHPSGYIHARVERRVRISSSP